MKHLNNPLNIRYKECNNWLGQLKPLNGFCRFSEIYYGWRAAVILIYRYHKFGVVSVKDIISRWSPGCDKYNTSEYVRFVLDHNHWSDDKKVCFDDDIYYLLLSMARIEQGYFDSSWENSLRYVLLSLFDIHVNENSSNIF